MARKPYAPKEEVAIRMVPILERGTEALRFYIVSIPLIELGDEVRRQLLLTTSRSLHVVTHSDFIDQPALCLEHVVINDIPLHILCPNGSLYALVEKRHSTW
jgi:hypothetical protein